MEARAASSRTARSTCGSTAGFLRRLLDLHLEFVDEVERELGS